MDISFPKCEGGMGFRDFQLFNQALLAKHGWKLFTNPDSLCARVLKGKYYHECDFMSACNKRHSSHTWRAILYGREVLQKGLIKRVGDGTTIRVWEDPWLPANYGRKPITKLPTASATMVEELIDHVNAERDIMALQNNFIAADVQAIQRIPISRAMEDVWAWQPEKLGFFSVRSAYKLLVHQHRSTQQASCSEGDEKSYWKKLWKLPVPPKVRNFWWRVINKFVPTRSILRDRHV